MNIRIKLNYMNIALIELLYTIYSTINLYIYILSKGYFYYIYYIIICTVCNN